MATLDLSKRAHPKTIAQLGPIIAEYNRHTIYAGNSIARKRFDADETNALALQLEYLRSTVYEKIYVGTKARMILPIGGADIPEWDESFAYQEEDYAGKARIISNFTDDLPTVENKKQKVSNDILTAGLSFSYSFQDLARAALLGMPLDQRKAMRSRDVYERLFDDVMAVGAPAHGIATGFLNRAIGTGDGQTDEYAMTSAAWDVSKVAATMLADLDGAVRKFTAGNEHTMPPTHMVISAEIEQSMRHTDMGDGTGETVMQRFLQHNPSIQEIYTWHKCKAIDAGANGCRGVLFNKDIMTLEGVEPGGFRFLAPERRNLGMIVGGYGRFAGCIVYQPRNMLYMTGLPNDPEV